MGGGEALGCNSIVFDAQHFKMKYHVSAEIQNWTFRLVAPAATQHKCKLLCTYIYI